MDSFSVIEKTTTWVKTSIILKLICIGILVLILLIPSSMLSSLIYERSSLQNKAIDEINNKWASQQTLVGPILTIPYTVVTKKDKSVITKEKKYAHFLPEKLQINGELIPLTRQQGIYKATLYESSLNISGNFTIPVLSKELFGADSIDYNNAFVQIGITDMRGITKSVIMQWMGSQRMAQPGIPTYDIASSGIHIPVNISNISQPTTAPFNCMLSLNGSSMISFTPVGKETSVKLKSSWDSPGFDGQFLPEHHSISKDGFNAEWNILHFNRNYPQSWTGSGYFVSPSQFGVRMVTPVEHYQMITRSVKYAVLIIFLTFLIFFTIEITQKYKVHPIQYLMIGTALTLFYALLLSLSEHITFLYAYSVSSIATIIMISAYSFTIIKKKIHALLIGLMFVLLYIFLYSILQSEDYALLIGSVGLFVLLGVIMFLTRKINWYGFDIQKQKSE